MIFVVGARRSGTNWLQRIIAAHPDVVAVPGETYLFSNGIAPLVERFHHGPVGSTSSFVYAHRDTLIGHVRDLCDGVFTGLRDAIDANATRIVERTPDHVRHLPLISEIYPDAHIVHIVRDGRDVVRSLLSQDWGPDAMEAAATEWRTAIEAARAAAPSIEKYREIRYEDLFARRKAEIADLYAWLGLEGGLPEAESASHTRYNVDQRDKQLGPDKWRTGLDGGQLATFTRVAGETQTVLGYPAPLDPFGEPHPRKTRAGLPERAARWKRRGRKASAEDPRAFWVTGQHIVDRLLSAAATGDGAAMALLFAGHATITLVDATKETLPVADGIAALLNDHALRQRQSRGDVYPSYPICCAAMQFENGAQRFFAVTIERGAIIDLVCHRSSTA